MSTRLRCTPNRVFCFRRTNESLVIDSCLLSFASSTSLSFCLLWKLLAITGNLGRPSRRWIFEVACFISCDPKGSFTLHASPLLGNLMRETTARSFGLQPMSSVTASDDEMNVKRRDRKYNGDWVKVSWRCALTLSLSLLFLSSWNLVQDSRCCYKRRQAKEKHFSFSLSA